MTRFAIKTPYLITVACLIVAILGMVSVVQMPVDMFPSMNIPVVVVATLVLLELTTWLRADDVLVMKLLSPT